MAGAKAESENTVPFGQILLDSPTASPTLGFDRIGRAFATIIGESQAQFAVGIFGGWGSGKTTLMKAIRAALPADSVVSVDFNAWRFEREPQLLIPLLDTIRAALVRWSEPHDLPTRQKVRSIATRVGRVVRALATGLSAEVGLPGAVTVSYDVGTALDALSPAAEPDIAQSLYVAAFAELNRVFDELSAGGVERVVVFVDDLDRCLPENALDVLESMKLFFDLPGFVFVVGLDEEVVERAIRSKFSGMDDLAGEVLGSSASQASQRLAREYVKKIFQLPYSLPKIMPEELNALVESMYDRAAPDRSKFDLLRNRVLPYLRYVAVDQRVNPREVKRFINAYTLQTLIRPELDSATVLALQTLAFRYDWESLYDAVLADSELFVNILRRYRGGARLDAAAFGDLAPDLEVLPPSLASYLRSNLAEPLTAHPNLSSFLSSLESMRSGMSWELDAYRLIGQLRRTIKAELAQDSISGSAVDAAFRSASEAMEEISGSMRTSHARAFISHLQEVANIASLRSPRGEESQRLPSELRGELIGLQAMLENMRLELQVLRNDSVMKP